MEYLSKQRYDEIAAELKHLTSEVYPKVKEELAEASAQGDRSDNAGYREARRTQGKTISRIRFRLRGRPSAASVSCRRSWRIPG